MSLIAKKPLVPENIENLKPYVAGKTIAEVKESYLPERIAKLASNENRMGISPAVQDAVLEALVEAENYPDPIARKLRKKIAQTNNLDEENIILTSGSESLLSMICRTFVEKGQNAVTPGATFVGFFVQAGVYDIELKKTPLTEDYRIDVKAMVNAVDENTKLVYIANPNNPTGTYINKDEFVWMMDQLPEDVLVLMDEAYFEFADGVEDYASALEYDYKNVIVLRTFSKAYGLAGFRLGYGIAEKEIIEYLLKTKLTFEPASIAQAAGMAAYKDENHLKESVRTVAEGRERLYAFFDKNNVKYVRSTSNSVMMILDSEDEAADFTQKMLEKGVILRHIKSFGLPKGVRISIGVKEDMDQFEMAFNQIYNR